MAEVSPVRVECLRGGKHIRGVTYRSDQDIWTCKRVLSKVSLPLEPWLSTFEISRRAFLSYEMEKLTSIGYINPWRQGCTFDLLIIRRHPLSLYAKRITAISMSVFKPRKTTTFSWLFLTTCEKASSSHCVLDSFIRRETSEFIRRAMTVEKNMYHG